MINLYDDFSSEEELDHGAANFLRRGQDRQGRGAVGGRPGPYEIDQVGQHQRRRQLPAVPSPPLSLDWVNLSAYGFPESVALSELPGSKFDVHYLLGSKFDVLDLPVSTIDAHDLPGSQ